MIIDDFSDIVAGTGAGAVERWNYSAGSGSNMTFVTGVQQAIELKCDAGEDYLLHAAGPTVGHQSVELKVVRGTGGGTHHKSGVLVRYIDTSNFIAFVFDHNGGGGLLFQRSGGVTTTLATPSLSADGGDIGVSIRLEVIGWRARYWFNPRYGPIEDEPPDGAVDIVHFDTTTPGSWGIYMQADSSSSGRVTQFRARQLPSVALPAPDFDFAGASGLSFTPITATVSSLPSDLLFTEWLVSPLDIEEIPEAYRDIAIGSATSRVFYARPGYTYDVWARSLSTHGVPGDWAKTQITASGSKSVPTPEILPDEEFPAVTPDYVLAREQKAEGAATIAVTGRERVSSSQRPPRNGWTMVFENRPASDIQQIMNFFDRMNGKTQPWTWTHPFGKQHAVRFDVDELAWTQSDAAGLYNLTFPITKVILGVVTTIAVVGELDPSLI